MLSSFRFETGAALRRLKSQIALAKIWRWEFIRIRDEDRQPFDVVYAGRKQERHHACRILGRRASPAQGGALAELRAQRGILVSEVPFPGALRVPKNIHMVVQLGRPLEDIVANYAKSLRRRLLKQLAEIELHSVTSDAEIERVYREMLVPYAEARHGEGAHNLSLEFVRKIALARGRLDLVFWAGEEVACKLGYGMVRSGKRYWVALRGGFAEAVFSDPDRLGETNSICSFAGLVQALESGFDFYDMGQCLPRFDDGNLQWKRRRGGALETFRNIGSYFVRLPRDSQARCLWDSPLFSLEGGGLSLRLGLPEGPSDEDVVLRYREAGFGGLSKVYLHCARPATDDLLRQLRSRYAHSTHPPELVVLPSS